MHGSQELSERELEILTLVARGASNKEIAQELFISTNTVKVHLRNIFSKIEVTSRTEAAMYAVSSGLLAGAVSRLEEEPSTLETGETLQEEETYFNEEDASGATIAPPNGSQPETVLLLDPAGEHLQPIQAGVETPPPAALSHPERRIGRQTLALLLVVGVLLGATAFWAGRILRPAPSQPSSDLPRWQTFAPMSVPRFALALAAYDGKLYAIAGESDQGATSLVEQFDPVNNRWTKMADKPTPVSEVGAVSLGGRIYVPGGRLNSSEVSANLEVFDPLENAWTQGASLPVALSAYALAAYEGRLYVFGGWDGEQYVDTVYEYNPVEDQWDTRSPLSSPRAYAGAAVAGSKIYLLGGKGADGTVLALSESYSPDRDLPGQAPWQVVAPMPEPGYGMGVTAVADVVHVLGGQNHQGQERPVYEYSPLTNTWQKASTKSEITFQAFAPLYPGIVPLGTQIFVVGGQVDAAASPENHLYQAIFTQLLPLIQ